MLSPAKLFLFRVAIPHAHIDSFLFDVLQSESVQFENFDSVNVTSMKLEPFGQPDILKQMKPVLEKLYTLDSVLEYKNDEPVLDKNNLLSRDYSGDFEKVNDFYKTYQDLYNQSNLFALQKEELESKVQKLSKINVNPKIKNLAGSNFLWYKMGYLPSDELERLKEKLKDTSVILSVAEEKEEQVLISLIGLKQDKIFIEEVLKNYNWQDWDMSKELGTDFDINKIQQKIQEVQQKSKLVNDQLSNLIKENQTFLKKLFFELKALVKINEVKSFFKASKGFAFVAFWTSVKNKTSMIDLIKRTTSNQCYIEGVEGSNLQKILKNKIAIPVLYDNLSVFAPFKDLVSGYALPAYGTIDPTPIFALTFLTMYGVMFSDLGHGFVLLLFGLYLLLFKKQKTKNFAKIISMAGVFSMIFGWLFGSFFGYENLIKPLWMKPMDNIPLLLVLSVGFGLIVITLGIVFNFINSIKTKDPERGIFDRFGLVGSLFFWGILAVASYTFITKTKINWCVIKIVIFVPIGLFLFKGPALWLMKKQKKPFEDGLLTYLLESGIEILDLFTGYLSNTMSFMRIGAFALAHSGLLLAVFSVMKIVHHSHIGGLLSGIVFVLGNLGIILLEGLIVWIQALRLEYYEFFTKFFREGTKTFKPIGF